MGGEEAEDSNSPFSTYGGIMAGNYKVNKEKSFNNKVQAKDLQRGKQPLSYYGPGGRGGGGGSYKVKPGKELYRPPGTQWNPEAQEFAPLTTSQSLDLGQQQQDNIPTKSVRGLRKHQPAPAQLCTDLDLAGLGSASAEVENTMKAALEDPNRLSGRSLMELVRQVFSRVVEGQRMAETAARFCISVIEREKKETFLECLLNTCQEWYHARDQLLRHEDSPHRWPAFICFLNEMYGLLKRKQLHLMTKYEGIPPQLVLLSLLGESCTLTLSSPSLHSVQEVESLFIVITHIGRDLQLEAPGQMSLLLTCLRDAFLLSPAAPQVRKTLLQLIELEAADWQLPAQAVMYYYPGASL